MKASRLSINMTLVASLFYSGMASPSHAWAQATSAGSTGANGSANSLLVPMADPYGCPAQKSEIHKLIGGVADNCSLLNPSDTSIDIQGCLEKSNDCSGRVKELSETAMDGFEPGESRGIDDTYQAVCTAAMGVVNSGCAYELPDYDNPEADRAELNNLDQQVRDARRDARTTRQDAQKDLSESDNAAQEADEKRSKRVQELTEELQKATQEAEKSKADAVSKLRDELAKIDQQYLDLRHEQRTLESQRHLIQTSWGAECRLAADEAGQQAEAQYKAWAAEQNKRPRRSLFSSAAGRNRRYLKKMRRKITNRYNEVLKRCLKGEGKIGATIKMNLQKATRDHADRRGRANDVAAMLEKNRRESLTAAQQAVQSSDKVKFETVNRLQEQIRQADFQHMMANQRAMAEKMQKMNTAGENFRDVERDLDNINMNRDQILSEGRLRRILANCPGMPPKEAREKQRSAKSTLMGLFNELRSRCGTYNGCVNPSDPSVKKEPPILECNAILNKTAEVESQSTGQATTPPDFDSQPGAPNPGPAPVPPPVTTPSSNQPPTLTPHTLLEEAESREPVPAAIPEK